MGASRNIYCGLVMGIKRVISLLAVISLLTIVPASILYKYIVGRYRPVPYPDGPITARYTFIKTAYWGEVIDKITFSRRIYLFFLEASCIEVPVNVASPVFKC